MCSARGRVCRGRSGPGRPDARRAHLAGGRRPHQPCPVHAFASGPFARRCALKRAMTGAKVCGRPAPDDGYQDETYAPDVTLQDGDLHRRRRSRLRALHTPGHASNHVCLPARARGLAAHGRSPHERLDRRDPAARRFDAAVPRVAAAAAAAAADGAAAGPWRRRCRSRTLEIRRIVAHRLQREARVDRAAMHEAGGAATLDELLPWCTRTCRWRCTAWPAIHCSRTC
jgi:glyoxylase-like metal-dependent hydrolase (beta-lactamase superfamily II)